VSITTIFFGVRVRIRRHLSYANVLSTACLFIVLGGTSYAALAVTGKDVKRETLTGANVKDGSLLRKDFKKGQLPRGRRGQSGAQGAPGSQGPQGPPGPGGGTGAAPPAVAPAPVGQRLTITRSSGAPIVFPVLSSSFDGSMEGTSGGGSGSSKAAYEDLVLTKPPDATAHELLEETIENTHFPAARLEFIAPGSGSASASIELGETFITNFANKGSGESRTQSVNLKVGDPQNLTTSPPKLTWAAGATGLPVGAQKVGEMTIAGLSGTIDLFSVDWGLKQTGTLGGGGAGKAAFGDLAVVKAVDASSPALLKAMKLGTTFPKAEVRLLQPGSASLSTRYTLTEVQVTDYRLTVGSIAPEALKLGYRTIEQGVPGPGGTELKSCWDLLLNTDCG
jgi:type VI protein secretion system component Hcp